MYFNVKVGAAGAAGWEVKITRVTPVEKSIHTRGMTRLGAKPNAFPQPPETEQAEISAADVHHRLCTTTDAADIHKVYARVAGGGLSKNDVETFGRYLFATLIGEKAWAKIIAEAGEEPIELTLLWGDADWELHRLPWEMMRNADGPLAGQRSVSVARAVPVAKAPAGIILRPKVLFVVGSDLNDPNVRPGAEYLGLLRRLESLGISFCSRVLNRATSQQIEDEIARFQPSIVHFICHGWFDVDGRGYLEVAAEKPADPPQHLYASSLIPLLKAAGELPPVVVLNACYTATPPLSREAPPIAVELVKGGVPIVVGMGGRVADTACRLFTRKFYEALHQGDSVAAAAAHGRRAGLMHLGAQADLAVDWALPTLFTAEGLPPQVPVDTGWVARLKERNRYADVYRSNNTPRLFCDRHELIDSYYRMLNAPAKSAGGQPAFPHSVIAVEVDSSEATVKDPKYGKTRLLEEMSAQAARDGHVPCLVTFKPGETPPTTAMQLGMSVATAVRNARETFGLTQPEYGDYEFVRLKKRRDDPQSPVHPKVMDELDFGSPEGKVVRTALLLDLLALQKEAGQKFGSPNLKVVVLVDELHRFDDAAREFVHNMLGPSGLGSVETPVPVVFTFTGVNTQPEYNAAILTLKSFLEKSPLFVNRHSLGAFRPPKDEWLLYQQFLLTRDNPLIVKAGLSDEGLSYYDLIYEQYKGVPSQLTSYNVELVIKAFEMAKVFVPAEDEDVLKQHPWGRSNGD